jgi:hypothetical protein
VLGFLGWGGRGVLIDDLQKKYLYLPQRINLTHVNHSLGVIRLQNRLSDLGHQGCGADFPHNGSCLDDVVLYFPA